MEYKILNKEVQEKLEIEKLASYAMKSKFSRGRKYPQSQDPLRTEYQRDRDRIIHSTAFRKLEYKTQVYLIYEGDYYRTRLTHTLEVAQIARSISMYLNLNVDLTEAIALAHDLGHTPFGHSGEVVMNRLMADEGGFEHNRNSLRVVEYLEERYPDIRGLNLTFEVREGIIKHETDYDKPEAKDMLAEYLPDKRPTLEAQVVNVADEIAFNNHDLDDALKAGLIEIEDLEEIDWIWKIYKEQVKKFPHAPEKFIKYKIITTAIDQQIHDVLETSIKNLKTHNIKSVEDVRNQSKNMISFSDEMNKKLSKLKNFLYKNVYRHPKVIKMSLKGEYFIERLFNWYYKYPEQLPLKFQKRIKEGIDSKKQVICDYISGMTDRYAYDEYKRCFEPYERM